jgi:hypothetical protein
MSDPPVFVGAVKVTVTLVDPGVIAVIVGAGTMPAVASSDSLPPPSELMARIFTL